MISSIISRLVILLFGTLYPAYASYKAVKSKDVKQYVKWMMYWIVFALFTCIETFTDVFLSWFPFYFEIKIILVIWLLSPATKGSSILYRKFVHPTLSSREQEIDEYISKAKEQSYKQVLDLGSKGVSALMQTALKGGGGIVNQLKRSYSLSDLSDTVQEDVAQDETDDVVITDPRLVRRRRSPQRSSSSTSAIYFSEVDVRSDRIASIQSAEDISSGYSSSEGLYAGGVPKLAAREGLHRAGSLTRSRTTRVTRSTVPRRAGGSDESDENEVYETNIIFHNDKGKNIERLPADKSESSREAEFLDSLDSMHDDLGEEFNITIDSKSLITACDESQLNLVTVEGDLTKNSTSPVSKTDELTIQSLEPNTSLLEISGTVETFSNFVQNLIDTKNETNSDKTVIDTTAAASEHIKDSQFRGIVDDESRGTKKASVDDVQNKTAAAPAEPSKVRKGKYNKKAAPPPPTSDSPSAIKATLILKPGVVKTFGSAESLCKEIFVSSPKSKRRSAVNRSPSSLSSTSFDLSRSKHSFAKFIKFPKKIGFWNKDELPVEKPAEKRPSWHSYLRQDERPLSDSKLQSKSDNNLLQIPDVSLHGANSPKNGSRLFPRTIRGHVEDID
ncbi:receptor expression enhancing protein A isoform X2 [Leptinotarsa decemlineata]|uniref:receptor expression enhancing protein A isoform X2 n=1 Tax=Leptinotarsa decemlineata TaxID=7539 RepID=UPI003D307275